jgi:hypothetical protein
MAKNIKNVEDKEIVTVEVAPKQVKITNMMQADWIAPIFLVGGIITTAKRNVVKPLQSVIVDEAKYLAYKKTRAFQARLDLKLLVVSKANAPVKATVHDLTSAPITEPPPELQGKGNERQMEILKSPVTLELNTMEKPIQG